MPPTSRGLFPLSVIRRHASTGKPIQGAAIPRPQKPVPKPRTPSQHSGSRSVEPQTGNPKHENPKSTSQSESSQRFSRLRSFLNRHRYLSATIRWTLVTVPILYVAWEYRPYELVSINGRSMAPYFNAGSFENLSSKDWVLVQRWQSMSDKDSPTNKPGERSDTILQRGKIVIYRTPRDPNRLGVKRIVAIPGDLVQPLPRDDEIDEEVVIPFNHVWVEGDVGIRKESLDSNFFGPMSSSLIEGEVIAVVNSFAYWNWRWIDWREDTWPARDASRVREDAFLEAAIDPEDIDFSNGWQNGSFAAALATIKEQPGEEINQFMTNYKQRQKRVRLYNNAVYVARIAQSEQVKQLAKELKEEMEQVFGKEALGSGIQMRMQSRFRGQLPDASNSKFGQKMVKDNDASDAEIWLRKQGWELERNSDGTVKISSGSR